jgi:hypothetical protein
MENWSGRCSAQLNIRRDDMSAKTGLITTGRSRIKNGYK